MDLRRFTDSVVQALDCDDPDDLMRGREPVGLASVASGAAGIALFLGEIARRRGDAHLLAQADRWCTYAEGLTDPIVAFGPEVIPGDLHSVMLGSAGIGYVRVHLADQQRNPAGAAAGVARFVEGWERVLGVEAWAGTGGFLMAARDLLQHCMHLGRASVDALESIRKHALQRLEHRLEQPLHQRHGDGSGMAHGITGELYSCLSDAPRSLVAARLEEFAELAIDQEPLILWPARIGDQAPSPFAGSCCNGIAGQLLLWCRVVGELGITRYAWLAERSVHDLSASRYELDSLLRPGWAGCGHGSIRRALPRENGS